MPKPNKWSILTLIACLVAGCSLIPYALALAKKPNQTTAKSSDLSAPAIPVEVATAKIAAIPEQIDALGSLTAVESVTLSSEVDGRIAKIFFQDGQQVAKGMPIIQLDNTKDKADFDSAVASLNVARNKYNRAQLLITEGAISKQDLEQLKADVESKDADVKTNLAALQQKELLAPFDGTLGAFNVQQGDFIKSGDTLVKIVNTQKLKVEYTVPEIYRPQLQLNQQTEITSSAYPNKVFYGTVTFISPSVDVATRSIGIQAEVDNSENLLSPGMFVHVSQNIDTIKNALIIPEQAIIADIQGYSVFVVTNNKVNLVSVKVGIRVAGNAQILSGLNSGDIIVIAGQQKLHDNDSVKVIN